MARFIVIDGLDGCGKATQTNLLKEALEKKGKKVVKIDFPKYDSDSSAAVRMYLNGDLGNDPTALNPYMCGTFYAVDRFIQYATDRKKYFEEDDNTVIIADRYLSANIIHQGGKLNDQSKRFEYAKWCYNLECDRCGLPKEDITIILTIKPEISQKLMTERYNGDENKKDIHEANLDYLKDCYNYIKSTITDINNAELANWVNIDCEDDTCENVDTRENIHNKIMDIVNKTLSVNFNQIDV
jgi:dTMP kinase